MTKLEKLEAYAPEIINQFLDTGKSLAIEDEMQKFIEQLQWAAEIKHYHGSISQAAKKLAERVRAVQNIKMSVRLARERIADAINYFHVDLPIAQKVWDMQTADKLEDLAKLMIADDKLDSAGKYLLKANELRKRANEAISNEDLKAPVFLISDTISHEDLGFEKENLKEIAQKDNDGFYLKLINSLEGADPEDKKRLLKDAEIHDVDFEEIENDGQ